MTTLLDTTNAAMTRPTGRALVDRARWFVEIAAFALGLVALSALAVVVSGDADVAAWWPAAGLACAVAAVRARHLTVLLATIAIATCIGNMLGGRPLGVAIGFALANSAEVAVFTAIWTRTPNDRSELRHIGDMGRLIAATVAGAATITAGAALTVAVAGGPEIASTARAVFPSHATAVLLFVPFVVAAPSTITRRRTELAGSWIAASAGAVVVFWPGNDIPLAFMPTMFVGWAAVRLGIRATAAQLFVVGVTATVLSQHGGGPFHAEHTELLSATALVQLLVLTNAFILLPLSIVVSERETAALSARASELMYRAGFSEAIVGMMLARLDPDQARVIAANDAVTRALGIRTGAALADRLRTDSGDTIHALGRRLAPGHGWGGEMTSSDGRCFDVAITRLAAFDHGPGAVSVQLIDTTERHQMETRLTEMALSDSLTGLPNRTALRDRLDLAVADVAPHSALAVVFLDIDDFKTINDAHGHSIGDQVLVDVAHQLGRTLGEGDTLARIGGDEFVMLCVGIDAHDAHTTIVNRVSDTAGAVVDIGGLHHHLSFSAGIALSTPDATSEVLLRQADAALYDAKATGKRRVSVYTDAIGEQVATRLRIETELPPALANDEFEMHMQPVIDIPTGKVVAAEALIRWRHPHDGLRPPGLWLDVAERSGLLPELGAWALAESIRQAATWIDTVGHDDAPAVHVNVSARQLDRPGFSRIVFDTLERYEFPADKLVLELTETYLAAVPTELVAELDDLADHGVQIAADDYGTGYSPLTRIVELPVSMIKIDRQFIDNMDRDPRAHAVVMSMLRLAETLDFEVVAEGVETDTQVSALRALGCSTAQGYFWSKPVHGSDFLAALLAGRTSEDAPALGDTAASHTQALATT